MPPARTGRSRLATLLSENLPDGLALLRRRLFLRQQAERNHREEAADFQSEQPIRRRLLRGLSQLKRGTRARKAHPVRPIARPSAK